MEEFEAGTDVDFDCTVRFHCGMHDRRHNVWVEEGEVGLGYVDSAGDCEEIGMVMRVRFLARVRGFGTSIRIAGGI